jgi:beta-glucosidase
MKHVIRTASATALCGAFLASFACGHIDPPIPPGGVGAGPGTGGTGPGTGGTTSTGGTGGMSSGGMGTGAGPTCVVAPGGTPLAPQSIAQGATPTQCYDAMYQQFDPQTMPGYCQPQDPQVKRTLDAMTLPERVKQMQGVSYVTMRSYEDIERSLDVTVSSSGQEIRGYRYRDAGRGVNLDAGQDNRIKDDKNYATAFPQQSARGASWDLDLEYRIGEAIGDETAASLNNMLLAPCMNIIRHPYWGRTQETYSEDAFHVGRMASALTAGVQQHVAACAKHYAGNNIEKGRATQDAVMDEQTLREIYLRHFEMVVQDGGVSCIMAAYNKLNGKKLTQNKKLLTDILRGPLAAGGMAFRGTVLSDWWAMPGDQGPVPAEIAAGYAKEAAEAGMDIEVPWDINYGQLETIVGNGQLDQAFINKSAERVLEQKFRFKTALASDNWGLKNPTRTTLAGASISGNEQHLELAEEAAIKSAVLLRNGVEGMPGVLPIMNKTKIVVAGLDIPFSLISTTYPNTGSTLQMATHVSLGDRGSSRVNADPAKSVGPFDGIKTIGANHGATDVTSAGGPDAATVGAAVAAANPDLIVAVVGLTPGDEGEEYAITAGGDRATMNLPHGQNEFITAMLDLMKPTVIIIQSGSIVALPWLDHANKNVATIWAGYPGQRGGIAYGKLLFGEANFSGKMPMAWPLEADLQPFTTAPTSTTMGYFFGYREFDRRVAAGETVNLVFPFGQGLSYSTFKYENLRVPCTTATEKSIVEATIDITNMSGPKGAEVPMLFIKGPVAAPGTPGAARAVKELKSFNRVELEPGMGKRVPLPIRVQDLRHWEGGENGRWVIDKGTYTVLVGRNAADAEARALATPPLVGTFIVE